VIYVFLHASLYFLFLPSFFCLNSFLILSLSLSLTHLFPLSLTLLLLVSFFLPLISFSFHSFIRNFPVYFFFSQFFAFPPPFLSPSFRPYFFHLFPEFLPLKCSTSRDNVVPLLYANLYDDFSPLLSNPNAIFQNPCLWQRNGSNSESRNKHISSFPPLEYKAAFRPNCSVLFLLSNLVTNAMAIKQLHDSLQLCCR
jgi:hypothetical protein